MVEYLKKKQDEPRDLGFTTSASVITDMLKDIRQSYLGHDKNSAKMRKKLLYAIEKLNSKRSLYAIDNNANFSDDEESAESSQNSEAAFTMSPMKTRKSRTGVAGSSFRRRHSVQVGTNWMQEYSTFNMAQIHNRIVASNSAAQGHQSSGDSAKLTDHHKLKKAHSLDTLKKVQQDNVEAFRYVQTHEFNLFKFAENMGRQHTLPHLIMHLLINLPTESEEDMAMYNEHKLVKFLNEI